MNRLKYLVETLLKALFGTPQSKYDARYALLHSIAHRSGFRLYNKNLSWIHDNEYMEMWRQFPQQNNALHERRFNLFNLAKLVRRLPGEIAECGVFHAAGSFAMLSATQDTQKQLHGFDSFEGLSEPREEDKIDSNTAFKWKKHDLTSNEAVAISNLARYSDRVTLYRGWIPERFDEVYQLQFCLVHIDVDLYEPTKAALDFFMPRIVPGGLIICDDYGFETCPGAKRAMDEVAADFGLKVAHLTTGQGLIIKV